MKLKVCKNVKAYSVVQVQKNNRVVKVNKRTKRLTGVIYPFPERIMVKTLLFNGKRHEVSMDVPQGVRVYGLSRCLISMDKKEKEER